MNYAEFRLGEGDPQASVFYFLRESVAGVECGWISGRLARGLEESGDGNHYNNSDLPFSDCDLCFEHRDGLVLHGGDGASGYRAEVGEICARGWAGAQLEDALSGDGGAAA